MRIKTEREKELETSAVLAAAALVFFLIFKAHWLAWLALALLVTGLFFEKTAAGLSRGWMAFAETLGGFNSRLLLGLVYYLVITPVGTAFRLVKGDPLGLKRDGAAATYLLPRDHAYTKGDFDKMW